MSDKVEEELLAERFGRSPEEELNTWCANFGRQVKAFEKRWEGLGFSFSQKCRALPVGESGFDLESRVSAYHGNSISVQCSPSSCILDGDLVTFQERSEEFLELLSKINEAFGRPYCGVVDIHQHTPSRRVRGEEWHHHVVCRTRPMDWGDVLDDLFEAVVKTEK